jgi:cytochrome c-type biogenesis protein CcmH
MRRYLWLLLITAAFALLLALPAKAQQATPSDDQVNAIARQLYCPVCENIPLDVCPTTACAQWRALIREKLAQGWTEEQIKQYFVEQYGARVLGEPPRQGWNWLVYILPPLLVIGGLFVVFRLFRSWKSPATAAVPPAGEADSPGKETDEYLKRFEDEANKKK